MDTMLKNTKIYDFRTLTNATRSGSERHLVCPRCKENLTQPDIEVFSRCPFCNYRFELNVELEDFILEPVVENWIRQQNFLSRRMREEDFFRPEA